MTNRNIDRSISLYNPCKRNLMTIKQQSSEPSEQGTSKFQEYLEHAIRHKGEEFPDAPQAINRTISNPLDAIQVKSSQLRHKRCTRQSLAYSISLMLKYPNAPQAIYENNAWKSCRGKRDHFWERSSCQSSDPVWAHLRSPICR